MSKELRKGLKLDTEKSCGYLQAYLESPGILRHVYKIARLLVIRNSHLLLVGSPRVCGREILQLSTLAYPDTVLYEPEVMMSQDFIGFRSSLRQAMLMAISSDKDIVFLYDTNHLDDPIYISYIYNYISLFDRDSIEMFDREFCDQLINAEREYTKFRMKQFPGSKNIKLMKPFTKAGGRSKDIYSYESGKSQELSDNELYTLAISKLSARFHIVIHSNGIKDYKEINKYASLESKMTVMFLEDIVNEDCHLFTTDDIETTNKTNFNMFDLSYDSFTRMQLQSPVLQGQQDEYQDTEVEIDRKNKQLAKRMIDMKSKIHNSILDFYKVVIIEDPDDEIAPGIPATAIPPPDMKLEMISGLINKHLKVSPYLDVPMSVNYNSKFVILHEMIKFMHDFLSTSLMMRNNYYESLVEKSQDLSEFYESTVVRKKDLHSKNHTVTVQMLDLQDQISRVDSQLEDIKASISTIVEKRKQQGELEKEVEKVFKEKDRRIKKIVSVVEQTTGADYEFVLKNTRYGTAEDFLIKTLGKIINEDVIGFRNRQELEILFSNSTHLCKILLSKKDRDQSKEVFSAIKNFVIKHSAPDFSSRPLMKNLFRYLLEIYRKMNLKNSMGSTIQKIEDIKTQTTEAEISIEKRKEETVAQKESLEKELEKCKSLLDELSNVISSTEISNVRSAQIISSITTISSTAAIKLEHTQSRIRTILGDAILLSYSVIYLGIFSMRKKIEFRKILKETLKTFKFLSSPEWSSEDPEIH